MANYRDIKGFQIQSVSSDPVPYSGSWSSGGALNTARYRFGGAVNATQTAGLVFGGGSSPFGQTEEYNGSTWSEQNDLNTGRWISYGGGGTQTACITAGGYNPAGSPEYTTVVAEEYDGTSWTEVNDLNEGRIDCSTFGTSTDAFLVGGAEASGGPGTVTSVENWNGTSWTETTDIPTATQEMGSLGTGTAALIFGGSVDSDPSTKNTTVEWNGSSWTAGGNYPINIKYTTGFGTLTEGIAAGGYTYPPAGAVDTCANYNGTSWTTVNSLATARNGTSGNGTGTSGFVAGGYTTTEVATTEEWSFPPITANILVEGQMWFNTPASALKTYGKAAGIPAATWASGTNFPSSTYGQSGFGTQTSAMIAGGPTALSNTQTFNGSSFTAAPAMNTASPPASRYFIAAIGSTSTAGIMAGGEPGQNSAETWDGSSWTEVNNLNTGRNFQAAMGVSTAGLVAGGYTSTARTADTETWDGTNWTETNNLNTARRGAGGAGSQTSGIAFGGNKNPNNLTGETETWDGSAWTEVGDMNTAREFFGAYGPTTGNTSAMVAGGLEPGNSVNTEVWNGSSWTEVNNLATARRSQGAAGTSIAAVLTTGEAPPGATNATELFTADNAVSTVTTS